MSKFNKKKIEVILSQPYVNLSDIGILVGCSRSKASSIKQQVRNQCMKKNIPILDSRWLPTTEVLNYLANDTFNTIYHSIYSHKGGN